MVENMNSNPITDEDKHELSMQSGEENLRIQLRDYQLIERCTKPALNSHDLLSIMSEIRDYFSELFTFDRFGVFVQLTNEKFCVIHEVVAQDDIVAYPAGSLMSVKGTGVEYVLTNKRTHYNPDVQSYQQFLEDQELAHHGIRTLVRIPFIHEEQAFAVMTINSIRANQFAHGEVAVMERIAAWFCNSVFSLKLMYALQVASYIDGVSSALNRTFLADLLTHHRNGIIETIAGLSLPDTEELSLLFIDVNRFKQFNHKFGYPEGDKLLMKSVQLIREVIQEAGFIIRFASDEFLAVLPGVPALDAERLKNEIQLKVLTFNAQNTSSANRTSLKLKMRLATGNWAGFEQLIKSVSGALDEQK